MKKVIAVLACSAGLFIGANAFAQTEKPTVVLVHGAFADASSWNGVARILEKDGYTVVAAANPLRSVKSDGAAVSALLTSIKSPVVLVGHSYGGNVISEAANDHANVKALVYVSAFAPEAGNRRRTCRQIPRQHPGPNPCRACPADGWRQGLVHPASQVPRPVRRGCSRRTSGPDGRDSTAGHGSGFERAGRAARLEAHSVLVHLWRQGQEHPAAGHGVHGPACRGQGGESGQGRVPCGDGFKPRAGRSLD